MYKFPAPPSRGAWSHEVADFMELSCLNNGSVSLREIATAMGQVSDNFDDTGCENEDDACREYLDEVMREIDRRITACNGGYPFIVSQLAGASMRLKRAWETDATTLTYVFLLFATRLKMDRQAVHNGVDGTKLFEKLCEDVLKKYFGTSRVKTMIFGTSCKGTFCDKIDTLCKTINEGGGFRGSREDIQVKDDKVDLIAWLPFSDEDQGVLSVFAQCKTGTEWREHVAKTRPDAFISKWCTDSFAVLPLRAYMIAESYKRKGWRELCLEAGLMFDRTRIVEFADQASDGVKSEMIQWIAGARKLCNAET